jgi:mandelamide amidase
MAPLGVAEDTEGSIRVPAALCGIAGFRPTTGRYPSQGVAPISALFDQVGPQARTVADLALFDAVCSGESQPLLPTPLKGVKLAVARGYFWAGLHPDVELLCNSALSKLREAGAEIVEAELDDLADLIRLTTSPIQLHDVLVTLPKYLSDSNSSVTIEQVIVQCSPDLKAFFDRFGPAGAARVTEEIYRAAVDTHLPRLREAYRAYFTRTGAAAIVFPTTMVPATTIGQNEVEIGAKKVSFSTAISRNIAPGSTVGLPGLVLPTGLTPSGLPVSLEFDGPAASDRNLLAFGLTLEKLLGPLPAPTL